MDTYILDESKTPRKAKNLREVSEFLSNEQNRRVGEDTIFGTRISTVFLVLDHNYFEHGPPLLFETMIFGPGESGELIGRCSTWKQAVQMHLRTVEEIRRKHLRVMS